MPRRRPSASSSSIPKGRDYSRYKGATILTPNQRELSEAAQMPAADDKGVEQAAKKLLKITEAQAIVVTRGADGMSVVPAKGKALHLPALAREVFDVSGAGDTVVATLATALAGGLTLEQAARLASVAASVVVAKVGVRPSPIRPTCCARSATTTSRPASTRS